jgi:hypothetical protein
MLLCGVHDPIVDGNPPIYSVEVFAKFKADHEAKMAPKDLRVPSPQPATETVDLSLLLVTSLPVRVWTAKSLFRTTEEVAAHLLRPRGTQVLPLVQDHSSDFVRRYARRAERKRMYRPTSCGRRGAAGDVPDP